MTDPRLAGAMEALDDAGIRENAVGGGFREHLRSHGIVVPNELAVHLSVASDLGLDSPAVLDIYCFHYTSVDSTGTVHNYEIGVHHDSTGWHWGS